MATTLKDISDGTSNTLNVVELKGHSIHWMSTDDPQLDEFLEITKSRPNDIGWHPGGFYVSRVDGSVFFQRDKFRKSELLNLLIINNE